MEFLETRHLLSTSKTIKEFITNLTRCVLIKKLSVELLKNHLGVNSWRQHCSTNNLYYFDIDYFIYLVATPET